MIQLSGSVVHCHVGIELLKTLLVFCIPIDFGLSFLNRRFRSLDLYQYEPTMAEELLWGVKNGDLEKVRDLIEQKVGMILRFSVLLLFEQTDWGIAATAIISVSASLFHCCLNNLPGFILGRNSGLIFVLVVLIVRNCYCSCFVKFAAFCIQLRKYVINLLCRVNWPASGQIEPSCNLCVTHGIVFIVIWRDALLTLLSQVIF